MATGSQNAARLPGDVASAGKCGEGPGRRGSCHRNREQVQQRDSADKQSGQRDDVRASLQLHSDMPVVGRARSDV